MEERQGAAMRKIRRVSSFWGGGAFPEIPKPRRFYVGRLYVRGNFEIPTQKKEREIRARARGGGGSICTIVMVTKAERKERQRTERYSGGFCFWMQRFDT